MRSKRGWPRQLGAFAGGVLVANSAPHLATAVAGRRHLVPSAGRGAPAGTNLAWGLANLAGGLAVTALAARTGARAWDRSLLAFEAGGATFALWMLASEGVLGTNHRRR